MSFTQHLSTTSLRTATGVATALALSALSTPAMATAGQWDSAAAGHNGTGTSASTPWISALAEGSSYAEWNAIYGYPVDDTPDIAGAGTLTETTGSGFPTSGGNIYGFSGATAFTLERDARGHWLSIHHIGATRAVPRQRVEFAVLTLLVLCSWLTRRDVQPLAVEFMAQAPSPLHEARYRQAFGLLPRFGERANRFLLSQDDLLAPIPTHNPELLALHEKLVESELDQLGQAGVGARVRHEIARLLPQGEPRREEVAAVLGLTDRTLQRRLQAESTSYQQLLDDTRRELARQYLGEPRHSLAEVADLLGFVDQSNLFRACRRWFGMPPGQYRQQLRA